MATNWVKTEQERFWEKVNKNGPTIRPELGPCWVWIAATGTGGYGTFGLRGKARRVHRVSWFFVNGEFPAKDVLHRCDNPPCVRPDHLWLGDDNTNAHDRKEKGRNGNHKGVTNGRAILTDGDVRTIRKRYADGTGKPTAMSREYGVSLPTIWYALKHGWKHV